MDDIYKNIKECNPNKKTNLMTFFDDMIVDTIRTKKLYLIVTELFIRRKKLNISFDFITQSYFVVIKNIRLNSTQYFVMKIPKKRT